MEIDSRLLKGMIGGAAKGDIRFYLNGVHMFGDIIEATNGAHLFRAKIDKFDDDKIFSLIGNIPKKSDITTLDFEAKIATHRDFMHKVIGVSYIEEIDGKFPNTQEVIVDKFKPKPTKKFSFNPKYLALPHKLFGAIQVHMQVAGEFEVAKITFKAEHAGKDIDMYLMPMQVNR